MRSPIAEDTKNDVVPRFGFGGYQRDKIASDMQLGPGTVSEIITDWKKEIGLPERNCSETVCNRITQDRYQHL